MIAVIMPAGPGRRRWKIVTGGGRSRRAALKEYSYRAALPLACLAGLLGVVSMAVHWHVPFIFAEHPQEYSENAIYLTTVLLLQGQNPWALENLPQFANVYGIFYNLVALPVAAVFGCTFTVHRSLSAALLLLCCMVIVLVLRRYRTPLLLALAAPWPACIRGYERRCRRGQRGRRVPVRESWRRCAIFAPPCFLYI